MHQRKNCIRFNGDFMDCYNQLDWDHYQRILDTFFCQKCGRALIRKKYITHRYIGNGIFVPLENSHYCSVHGDNFVGDKNNE
jgi:hypothetical protein